MQHRITNNGTNFLKLNHAQNTAATYGTKKDHTPHMIFFKTSFTEILFYFFVISFTVFSTSARDILSSPRRNAFSVRFAKASGILQNKTIVLA